MYSLLGVGGHLSSSDMGELLYTVLRYLEYWLMAEETVGGQSMVATEENVPKSDSVMIINCRVLTYGSAEPFHQLAIEGKVLTPRC